MGHLAENIAQYSIPALAALAGIWLSGRRTRARVAEVRALAEPTGNGFARDVRQALTRIEAELQQVRTDMTQHLRDHATPSSRRFLG